MDGPEGGSDRTATPRERAPTFGSGETSSSGGASAAEPLAASPTTNTCPHKTSRHWHHECSRYLDCPSHSAERVLPDVEDAEHGAEEDEEEETGGIAGQQESAEGQEDNDENGRGAGQQDRDRLTPPAPIETRTGVGEQGRDSERPADAAPSPGPMATTATAAAAAAAATTTTTSPASSSPRTAPFQGFLAAQDGDRLGAEAPRPAAPEPARITRPEMRPARLPSEIMLPRWQPDAEVTLCPICHTQFSIWVRKHHCRKCGRVVCGSCSPHRILIPFQYVVHPPGTPQAAAQRRGYPSSPVASETGFVEFNRLVGGERVRLCNPCVPDPNIAPPQTIESPMTRSPLPPRATTTANAGHQAAPTPPHGPYISDRPSREVVLRSRSATQSSAGSSSRPTAPTLLRSSESRILAGTPPTYYPIGVPASGFVASSSSSAAAAAASASSMPSSAAARLGQPLPGPFSLLSSMRGAAPLLQPPRGQSTAAAASSGSASGSGSASASAPRPARIPEEDECPVCHRELPARTLPDFEARREAHITDCIATHSTYGSAPRASHAGPSSGGTAAAAAAAAPAATAGGRRPRHARGGGTGSGSGSSNSGADAPLPPLPAPPPPPPPRRTRMFPYAATEKDCVDSAECTICLEEFEVGQGMARLECLCRFHRACIDAWFVGHPGRCPVHQHDGFGY